MKKSNNSRLSRFKKLPGFSWFTSLDRNIQLASILGFVLVAVGGTTVALRSQQQTPTQSAQVNQQETTTNIELVELKITGIEGVVQVRNKQGQWEDAKKDTLLEAGMGLQTSGAASRATVTLADNTEIRLGPGSEVEFEQATKSRLVLNHKLGYVYHRVMPTEGRIYEVHTETAQFQAEGTAFRTIANGDEESVEVYSKSVRETKLNLTGKEGEKLIAIHANVPAKTGTIEKLDIEELKKDSFIVWNRELELKNDLYKSQLGYLSDFDGPKIEVSDPQAGAAIKMSSNATNGTVTIKGKTEPRARLTVQSRSLAGSAPVDVTVGDDGSFTTPELQAPFGTSVMEFVATDRVGNKTTLNFSYSFVRESVVQQQGITLIGNKNGSNIELSWSLSGLTAPDGFKIVANEDEDNAPEFPDDSIKFIESTESSVSLKASDFDKDKTHYFRICRYIDATDACDSYSNVIAIEL